MRGKIPECSWFQSRILFLFCEKESHNNADYNETNQEIVQQTSHVDIDVWPKWKMTMVTILWTTNMKGKDLHAPGDILFMISLATSKMCNYPC